MNIHPKKFALFGNIYQAKKSAHVLRLLSVLESHQAEIFIHKEFYDFLTKDQKMDIHVAGVFNDNDFDADMVLSMGGDGTFLKAASYVGNKNIPILGINTGRLGFLADIAPEEIEETFEDIYKNNYKIEDRCFGVDNLLHRLDERSDTGIQHDHGDDHGAQVFDPAVTERVLLVRFPACKSGSYH